MLNKRLVAQQGLDDAAVARIEKLHEEMNILKKMPIEEIEDVRAFTEEVEGLEYEMQHEWGFKQDKDYHTHWYRCNACKCPIMDNDERSGTPYHIINQDCPLHGFEMPKGNNNDNKTNDQGVPGE